jgi:signal transduction histidine kinase
LGFFLGNAVAMLLVLLTLYPASLIEEDEPIGPDIAVLAAAQDLRRMPKGDLDVQANGMTSEVLARHPGTWFHAQVGNVELSHGSVPLGATDALARLPAGVRQARFSNFGTTGPHGEALILRVDTQAGPAVIAGGGIDSASISFADFLFYMSVNDFWWFALLTALLALAGALLVAPILLRGLRSTLSAAADIQPDDLDKRLPEGRVVKELLPLVQAFNNAFDRLASAAEQRKRFIADVAHELRTPLAVLNMHVEGMPAGGSKVDLQRTVFRLSHMVGQMLDAERLALRGRRREQVDLVLLARTATADAAPLALSHGYDMNFSSETDEVSADADPDAVSRALSNLLGNAVAHGGGSGTIEVRVTADGKLDISDEGPGVPVEARERIFEPFHRERWDRDGCGLGLHLVREIMRAHGGEASLVGSARGARFRLDFGGKGKS